MRRGEVWWANLPDPWGRRPVLLLARDQAYTLLTYVVVAPLTTRVRTLPTTVQLTPGDDRVPDLSVVNLDAIQVVQIDWLERFMVRLGPERMEEVEQAIHFALDLRS